MVVVSRARRSRSATLLEAELVHNARGRGELVPAVLERLATGVRPLQRAGSEGEELEVVWLDGEAGSGCLRDDGERGDERLAVGRDGREGGDVLAAALD